MLSLRLALAGLLSLAVTSTVQAQLPKRQPDLARPVLLRGHILKIDQTRPWVDVHFQDEATGKHYVFWIGTPNTLVRSGISLEANITDIVVDGYVDKAGPCVEECRIAMRSITLPDGRKLFLGSPGV